MYEKVNPSHPDKVADRIAGALVDYAYTLQDNPKIAVEVLIGHGECHIIAETSVRLRETEVQKIIERIVPETDVVLDYDAVPQDVRLAHNQKDAIRCGDNGIFKGVPITPEQGTLAYIAREIYGKYPHDGKYILDGKHLIICQSNATTEELNEMIPDRFEKTINPLGIWTGGTDVDTGATNRKLGSDMGDAVTGGGLHGKDLSKADVSVNIYAHLLAQEKNEEVRLCCAIGDETVNGIPYAEIVKTAHDYIKLIGGFEKLAEWGLI